MDKDIKRFKEIKKEKPELTSDQTWSIIDKENSRFNKMRKYEKKTQKHFDETNKKSKSVNTVRG